MAAKTFPARGETWRRRDGFLAEVGHKIDTPFGPRRLRVWPFNRDTGTADLTQGYITDADGMMDAPHPMAGDLVERIHED